MLKKGFTLQELLITLAIIGIVAAVTAPSIKNLIPNENKVKYMKAYSTLTSLTNEIVGDSSYYWTEYSSSVQICKGLGCTNNINQDDFDRLTIAHPELLAENNGILGRVSFGDLKGVSGYYGSFGQGGYTSLGWTSGTNMHVNDAKFPIIFASKLNLQTDPVCTSVSSSESSCTFKTVDGFEWTIKSDRQLVNNLNTISEFVTVDVDPQHAYGTSVELASENKIDKTDVFKFKISDDGEVTIPDDEYLAREFLKNPTDMHNKKAEVQNAYNAYKNSSTGEYY